MTGEGAPTLGTRPARAGESAPTDGLRSLVDPHGRCLPALAVHDLADRISGRSARANARWGWLRRPQEGRRLVWLVAGEDFASVRLAVELARAIHEARLDVAIVLTFEAEHPSLIERLPRSPRMGYGYAPADHTASLNAAWRRLAPLGLIVAGTIPRRNLARACAATPHSLLVAPPRAGDCRFERVYPGHRAHWSGAPSAPAADLTVMLTNAHVEPTVATLANGGSERRLWWWHGASTEAARRFIALFRGHLRDDLLFIGGPVAQMLPGKADGMLALSRWARDPIEAGTCVLIDDRRWTAAVAGAVTGVHFAANDDEAVWQALACGAAGSRAAQVEPPAPRTARVLDLLDDEAAVLASWLALRDDPTTLRLRSDASRGTFWQERRLAEQLLGELLDRVFDWN